MAVEFWVLMPLDRAMKKTKKEKQPVVTLYDVWKEGKAERVIVEGGDNVQLKGRDYHEWKSSGGAGLGRRPINLVTVEFSPNGEWVMDLERPSLGWRKSVESIVAYVFPVAESSSTSSAVMTEFKCALKPVVPPFKTDYTVIADPKNPTATFRSPHTSTRCVPPDEKFDCNKQNTTTLPNPFLSPEKKMGWFKRWIRSSSLFAYFDS